MLRKTFQQTPLQQPQQGGGASLMSALVSRWPRIEASLMDEDRGADEHMPDNTGSNRGRSEFERQHEHI